jgi:hypothetical protein
VRLILGSINGDYLMDLLEGAKGVSEGQRVTEGVWAAVAYATSARDSRSLIEWCFGNEVPLRFWGRLDEDVPVSIEILNRFLSCKSPNYVCKLVERHHAKVIWWRGYGVYVGSANLTYSAWNSNVEAGCFFPEAEIDTAFDGDLRSFFRQLDEHATPLTEELRDLMIIRARSLELGKVPSGAFWKHPSLNRWSGLVRTSRRAAIDRRRLEFLAEWHSTLQLLRSIGQVVSDEANRPSWVSAQASSGAQADQFLHAHYYHRTFDGRRANYEQHFESNRSRPEQAQQEAIAWWRALPSAPTGEDRAINETAPVLRRMLEEESLRAMTEADFRRVAQDVHAMREFARRVPNQTVRLKTDGTPYTIPEKLDALCAHIWNNRSANGARVNEVVRHVLYGGAEDRVPERLWDAVADPQWKLECMGISAFGEMVGWAMPDRFPPRNGRTSKALRSLGYPVHVHVT